MKRLTLPIAVLALPIFLAGCSQTAKQTARICDDSGCSERPIYDQPADYVQHAEKSAQISQLEELAESNPKAAYDLALRYFRGEGVTRNSYQAIQWMRKAGNGGLLEAQKALGGYYLTGLEEMGSDPQEAATWLSMAAAQGDQESAEMLPYALEGKAQAEATYQSDKRWRERYRGYWYTGYPYFGHWYSTYWHY